MWDSAYAGLVALAIAACTRAAPIPAAAPAPTDDPQRAAMRVPTIDSRSPAKLESTEGHLLERCFREDASGDPARPLEALLDRSAERFDKGDYHATLTCAEEAARVEPRSVEAHHYRATAFQALGKLPEAESAFERALALDPEDPETLAGAADLFINRLPASTDHSETGLEYARRGSRRVLRTRLKGDKGLVAWLALLEGEALSDLGRSREALARLDASLSAQPSDLHAKYERALALFDLCRFADAKRGFEEVIKQSPDDAWAHHHLGLTCEQMGDDATANRELAEARRRAPEDFRPPVEISQNAFRALVDDEAMKLPPPLKIDLAKVSLETRDLPELTDLIAEEPPLQPTILGLFRGAPLGESPEGDPRAIVIYRRNLQRATASLEELRKQVRTTLYHELGHLRGEDDDALRARGLE